MRFDELPSSDFLTVWASASPTSALARLGAHDFAVVLDEGGEPLAVAKAEDFQRAVATGAANLLAPEVLLPPTIVVGSSLDVSEVMNSQLMGLSNLGSHGAVLLNAHDGSVSGVVSFEELLTYSYRVTFGAGVAKGGGGGTIAAIGGVLGGDHTTPRAKVKCQTCGHVNTVPYVDKNHPPDCDNKAVGIHPLGI